MKYYVTRNFIAPETADTITNVCPSKPLSPACLLAKSQYSSMIAGINPYNVYGYCFSDTTSVEFRDNDTPFPYTPWSV